MLDIAFCVYVYFTFPMRYSFQTPSKMSFTYLNLICPSMLDRYNHRNIFTLPITNASPVMKVTVYYAIAMKNSRGFSGNEDSWFNVSVLHLEERLYFGTALQETALPSSF